MNQRPILLVEDNLDDQFLLQNALQQAKVTNPMKFFQTGDEAKAYLSRCEQGLETLPVLIFLDLLLEGENGLAFLEFVRQYPTSHCIPVIVLTQSEQAQHLSQSYRLGANSFVSKDSQLSAFNRKIENICDYWLRVCRTPVA